MSNIRYLLDTNIVIGALNAQPKVVELVQKLGIQFSKVAISQITRIELLGFSRLEPPEETKIHAFLDDCHVIMCDERMEEAAIRLRRACMLKLPDAIIAATAQVNDLELLTMDARLARAMKDGYTRCTGTSADFAGDDFFAEQSGKSLD